MDSRLAPEACSPLITCERGSAGSIGSKGSAGMVQRIRPEAPRITNSGDAPKSFDSRFPVLNFPNMAHLPANGKDFSLALEMTIRESKVF